VDYPEPDVEIRIVSAIMNNEDIAAQMVKFVNEVRAVHMGEEAHIPDTISTREIVEWAKTALFFQKVPRVTSPLSHALKYVVFNKASRDGRPVISEIYQRVFNQEL
jgi:cobaltochelatase CobS